MQEILLQRLIYGSHGSGGYRYLAQSPDIPEAWLPEIQRICTGFGERPPGTLCPHAVFAYPLLKETVAVVQVADQGVDDAGRPGAMAFYILLLPVELYRFLGGNPFHIADQCPAQWNLRGSIEALPFEPAPPAHRSVAEIQAILKGPDSPLLLGSAQALLDGGRLVLARPAPEDQILRHLWELLPCSTRCELWPATFAFGNALEFHALATPRPDEATLETYVTEEHAGDYPEGRYELRLQVAAEHDDQAELDRLFSRRSPRETIRLGVIILILAIVLPFAAGVISNLIRDNKAGTTQREAPPPKPKEKKPELWPSDRFPELAPQERIRLSKALHPLLLEVQSMPIEVFARQVGTQFGGILPLHSGSVWIIGAMAQPTRTWLTAEELLLMLDARLMKEKPTDRKLDLRALAPVQRRLQGLLWKHSVERYNDPRLSTLELLERLTEKTSLAGKPSDDREKR